METRKHQLGFTLLEMLIVLGIISVFILLAAPLSMDRLYDEQEKQFLNTLQSDILYAQNMAATSPEQIVQIVIKREPSQYYISQGADILFTRSIPENWIYKNHEIVFKKSGVVIQPASFVINTPRRSYKIVFTFGKGRARIEEI